MSKITIKDKKTGKDLSDIMQMLNTCVIHSSAEYQTTKVN